MDIIIYSFTWCRTQQGHEFWRKLHDEWNELYNKAINKPLYQD